LSVGQFDDAHMWIDAVEAGLAVPDILDHGVLEAELVALREVHAFKTGDLDAALEAARRAITLDFGDALHAQSVAYCFYGSALYYSGDIGQAQSAFRSAVSLAEEADSHLAHRYALGYLAMISAHQGRLAEAEELIRRATGGGNDLAGGGHFVEAMVSLAAAIILDVRGEAAAAAEAAEMAVGLARKGAGVLEVANALLARSEILGHLGEHAAAAASRDEAAMLLRRATDAGSGGRLLSGSQCGAGVAVSARNQAFAVGEELTAKELEVLGLLVTRLSRREIGQRLHVSLNTVKTHQRALYRKLGVEDRNTAVTRARELGLL
jgi:LuxR family maltose regulon positive regulatory protein